MLLLRCSPPGHEVAVRFTVLLLMLLMQVQVQGARGASSSSSSSSSSSAHADPESQSGIIGGAVSSAAAADDDDVASGRKAIDFLHNIVNATNSNSNSNPWWYAVHPLPEHRPVSLALLKTPSGGGTPCWVTVDPADSPAAAAGGRGGGVMGGGTLRPCTRRERLERVPVLRTVLEEQCGFCAWWPGAASRATSNDGAAAPVDAGVRRAPHDNPDLAREQTADAIFPGEFAGGEAAGAVHPVELSEDDDNVQQPSLDRRAVLAARVQALLRLQNGGDRQSDDADGISERHILRGAAAPAPFDSSSRPCDRAPPPLACAVLHWVQVSLPEIGAGQDFDPDVMSGQAQQRCACGLSATDAAATGPSSGKGDSDDSATRAPSHFFINRLPGAVELNRKDTFGLAVRHMQGLHGVEAFDFHPFTWVLARESDRHDLLEIARGDTNAGGSDWIAKDSFGGQGRGIYMLAGAHALEHALLHTFSSNVAESGTQHGRGAGATQADTSTGAPPHSGAHQRYVVQRYIPNPLLLSRQGGSKHTLRVYSLIRSVDPLEVWVHSEGLAKFAMEPFVPGVEAFADEYRAMHVTNNPASETSAGYRNPDPASGAHTSSHRWSLSAWRREIDRLSAAAGENFSGEGTEADGPPLRQRATIPDSASIWQRIQDGVVKSVLALYPTLTRATHAAREEVAAEQSKCGAPQIDISRFQVIGTDVEMDAHFKPWIIEHNINPMMEGQGSEERNDKLDLFRDIFALVGLTGTCGNGTEKKGIVVDLESVFSRCPEAAPIARELGLARTKSILEGHLRAQDSAATRKGVPDKVGGDFTLVFPSSTDRLQEKYESYIKAKLPADRLLWQWGRCVRRKMPGKEVTK